MKILNSKKALFGPGGGMGGPRKPISLLVGLLFVALGLIPLLFSFGVIGFDLPISIAGIILWVLSVVGGVILLWDAIGENMQIMGIGQQLRMASIAGGLLLLAVGLIPILNQFGVIGFSIPEFADIIKNVLFVVFGGLLLYGGSQGF